MSTHCGRTEIFDFEGGGILLIVILDLFRNLLNFWDPETSSGWHWCSVFKITTSLRVGYFILCSVTAPRLKRDSEPADLSCRQPIFSAGCSALCSACFPRNELLGVRGQSPWWLEPFDYSCFSFSVLLFLFALKSKRKSEQGKLWDSSAIRTRIKRLRLRLYPWARATSVWQNGLEIYSNPLILKSDGIGK